VPARGRSDANRAPTPGRRFMLPRHVGWFYRAGMRNGPQVSHGPFLRSSRAQPEGSPFASGDQTSRARDRIRTCEHSRCEGRALDRSATRAARDATMTESSPATGEGERV
jgi:hypothetical protein